MEQVLKILPNHISSTIKEYIEQKQIPLQEIRLRVNQAIEINDGSHVYWLNDTSFSASDATLFLNKISDFSLYRLEEELRNGFITIAGGHRIGISGSVIVENRKVKAIHHISSFNIRIAKPYFGIIQPYLPYLMTDTIQNTLIIGPPQSGKTTLLRDIANYCASSTSNRTGYKTAIVDERSEICASINGVPQHLLAPRIDVLDRCPKAEGMMMFIRSMSPELIIVDEIGSQKDVEAIDEVIHAGVQLVCTIHGRSLSEISQRPTIKELINKKVFQRFVILSNQHTVGEIVEIVNGKGQPLYQSRVTIK
ncbi:stage III sporulation protein AA [Gracilibacillus massiliensis]|uniref:stage III sporulation protein AA n=1 Tax=Gracilibacillus massiliensis TaxID=1564956 RepID=UPI00071D1512|nr:stage III sporulation protein AA [Gracilibacillus massiliensis]